MLWLGALSLVVFVVLNTPALVSFVADVDFNDGQLWAAVGTSAVLVLAGNVLRALRSKSLLDLARRGRFAPQLRTLALGYFFNLMLPMRAGEFVRAYMLARQLRISLLFTVTVVLVDRLLDVVLVSALILIAAPATAGLVRPAILILVAAAVALTVFMLLVRQNGTLMRLVWRGSTLFSPSLERRLRAAVWSVVHGFQQFLHSPRRVMRYLVLFALSWACYLGALVLFLSVVAPAFTDLLLVNVVAPFLAPEVVLVPSSFQTYVNGLVDFFALTAATASPVEAHRVAGLMWLALNVPIAIVGLASLFERGLVVRADPDPKTDAANSLARSADRGHELEAFLDSFFRRDNLAQALHELDVRGEIDLIRFFRGGSRAVTALIRVDGVTMVRKLVPITDQSQLKAQYEWLERYNTVPSIVRVLGARTRDDYYEIDLEFNPMASSGFSYVHTHSLAECHLVLEKVWETLYSRVYSIGEPSSYPDLLDTYIRKHLVARVEAAATQHEDLASALKPALIRIGGIDLLNFGTVLLAIRENPRCMADLGRFRRSPVVHGDLTIDNLLVDADDTPLIIDPDSKDLRGPVVDFGRLFQSLWGGYEFLNSDDSPPAYTRADDTSRAEIAYLDLRSARYKELASWLWEFAAQKLTEEELRALPFHVGLFYGRMLTHRVLIDPRTALTYYAKCVEFLNVFYRQYQEPGAPSEDCDRDPLLQLRAPAVARA